MTRDCQPFVIYTTTFKRYHHFRIAWKLNEQEVQLPLAMPIVPFVPLSNSSHTLSAV